MHTHVPVERGAQRTDEYDLCRRGAFDMMRAFVRLLILVVAGCDSNGVRSDELTRPVAVKLISAHEGVRCREGRTWCSFKLPLEETVRIGVNLGLWTEVGPGKPPRLTPEGREKFAEPGTRGTGVVR